MFRPLCRVVVLGHTRGAGRSAPERGPHRPRQPVLRPDMPPPASGTATAVQLAVQTLNQAGGVLGRRSSWSPSTTAAAPTGAAAAALELIKAGVVVRDRAPCSHSSLMAAPVYEAVGIPMMTPDSTHPRLTEEGRPNVFRLIGRDDEQGRMAGDWLAAQRPVRPIGDRARRQHLRQRSRHADPAPAARATACSEALLAAYAPGAADYAALIGQLREAGIGLLYVGGYGAGRGRGSSAPRASRAASCSWSAATGWAMEEFWDVAGAAGEGTIFTARRDPERRAAAAPQVLEAFRALGLGPCRRASAPTPRSRSGRRRPTRAGSARPGRGDPGSAPRPVRDRPGAGRLRRQGRRRRARTGSGRSGTTAATRPLPPAMATR